MPDEIHTQLLEQARVMYPDAVAVGQLHWPDYAAGVDTHDQDGVKLTKQEKQAMQDRAGGFPATVALVVTPSQLFVCAYKLTRTGTHLQSDLKGWSRDQLRVSLTYPYGSDDYARVELMTPDRRVELDAADARGVNRDFLAALT